MSKGPNDSSDCAAITGTKRSVSFLCSVPSFLQAVVRLLFVEMDFVQCAKLSSGGGPPVVC